jgi:hypothetical protein
MKFIAILFFASSISISSFCQKKKYDLSPDQRKEMLKSIPTKDDKIFYDEVVTVDSSLKKDQLFMQLRQWFVENFMESKNVLEVNDMENGLLTGKGTYKYTKINGLNVHSGHVMFVINMAVKDGKYRYQLYDFTATDENQSLLSSTAKSYTHTIDLNEILAMYKKGKREKFTRMFLDDMIDLVYYIKMSSADLVKQKSISDF